MDEVDEILFGRRGWSGGGLATSLVLWVRLGAVHAQAPGAANSVPFQTQAVFAANGVPTSVRGIGPAALDGVPHGRQLRRWL